MKAVWNGMVVAESAQTEIVDGVHYFPEATLGRQYFRRSTMRTTCPSKGTALYYDLVVDGEVQTNAAWYYPEPAGQFRCIKDHVAFFRGVKVVV
jgi:uncharacterized protein (DUF427 family)